MSDNKRYPKARKRFGQNFLHDQNIINDIISAIDPRKGQHLVEIGPGRGALTKLLLTGGDKLDVIELDRDLVPLLAAQFSDYQGLTIYQADALAFDYQSLIENGEKLRVIGNLPYNIATPLMFHLLSYSDCIEDMCFMLQREVVERICAQPGSKIYGRLSIMMQYQCETELLFIVPPEAFEPAPKVESAIIYLKPKAIPEIDSRVLDGLSAVVTKAFSQRRKTISNTLKNMISSEILIAEGIELSQRPETISLAQYLQITKAWLNNTNTLD